MRGERVCSTEGLDYLRRQGICDNPLDHLGNVESLSAFEPVFNLTPSGWFYQNKLTISRMCQDFTLPAVDEQARRVFPDISENGRHALERTRTGPYTIFAKLLLPALENAVLKPARMQTYVDATRVACALERYRLTNGKYPETLAPLVPRYLDRIPSDIIDGKPLRYRLNSDGSFLIYSVGWNRTDDGGQLAWKKQSKETSVDATSGDWVWQMRN
jgi:hypothetical protein